MPLHGPKRYIFKIVILASESKAEDSARKKYLILANSKEKLRKKEERQIKKFSGRRST